MTVTAIPFAIAPLPAMESTPERAQTFATNLRAVTAGVKDVQGWAVTLAAPEWSGDTAETHDHLATRYAARLDLAEAALEKGVAAAEVFETRLLELQAERRRLEKRRKRLNADIAALEVDAAADADGSRDEELRKRAQALTERAESLLDAIDSWTTSYDTAEIDFIDALRGVDTVAEARQAAHAPDRPNPDALAARMRKLADDPVALAAWWRRLSVAQRQALTTEHPGLVGNADGLPVADRDDANRAAVYRDIDHLTRRERDGQLTDAERDRLDNARTVRSQLDDYREHVDPATGREITHVVVYKPGAFGGDGGIAVSFGDPDTADHVSVNVPGLTTELSSLAGNLDKTHALHEAALGEGRGSVATIYWGDYDAPSGNPLNPWEVGDVGGVAFTGKAEAGGERFGDFVDGLRGSDTGAPAHVTAIGHSYGSTTLGHALADGLAVDDAVLLGSPGVPAATADALTEADVWIGSKDNDPVTLLGDGERGGLGALGQDPAEDDFGGRRFQTGDGSQRVEDLLDNHTSYFTGDSLDNLGHIVTDGDGHVSEQPHRGDAGGEYLTLTELLTVSSAKSGGEWLWDTIEDRVRR
ncbi:hypothetical protein JK386_06515 [Nocardioides sp. zg-536]|uniref:DUF1023 domain-containing protein n=1 Tax=Nocardioides faecalis TaxID=2803858 RepID=A0A939BSE4_9ACTN|nr:alpha/beta hydrolase [Nocardioides faecalis]MBM9459549.1 hypothetical protein [Nocardioides faecalis]MBS4753671.1 hypothetical protein [Nocardioides faecalis]QVI58081.1 hypothetical protein KG111_13810 [Nocardioides faecalis]